MKKFTQDEIYTMKEEFESALKCVNRENANIGGLIDKLNESDFFYAPASTRFHNSCYGGLLDHSLNVYHNLKDLVVMKHLEDEIDQDSVAICGLLHDISKMNYYEPTSRNKKVYSENGSKRDDLGYFDWVSEMGWKIRDDSNRFVYGSHEENSEFMVRCYIPLKIEESIAILHHHSGMSFDSATENISPFYNKYPLANLLHAADMIATFTDEATR